MIPCSMKFLLVLPVVVSLAAASLSAPPPGVAEKLPAPAARPVDFVRDIKPLFEASCVKCHAKGKDKGGFSLESREAFLRGGDTGAGAVVGKSGESIVVEAVSGLNEGLVMPKKGTHWSAEQVGLLRAWIDQGAVWPAGISFAKPAPENLQPRAVALAERPSVHPVDNLLASYFAEHHAEFPLAVDDRLFARRIYLDLLGLLPTPEQLDEFLGDAAPDKRTQLVRRLLADKRNYAEHWLTFWNDLLRNDYKGAGFIDGGRKQISGWLYQALIANKPYDRFVAELVSPTPESEGFSRGIIWRGNVNASMLPPMQAAQSVSQVFLGVNLKCASCHDSFVNDWSLADAYGMAAVYADEPLELIHCDKPTGKKAALRFLYPEIGALDPTAAKAARLQRFAELLTSPKNGRLSRTIVNRLWARLLGRGLVEPLDDMEKPAWNAALLDWLAEDFVAHGYDVKHTLETICTSRAYQLPTAEGPREKEEFVFRGPLTRRLSAEQFADAVSALTGDWARLPSSLEFDFRAAGVIDDVPLPKWIWTNEPAALGPLRSELWTAKAQVKQALKKGEGTGEAQAALDQVLARVEAAKVTPPESLPVGEAARHRVVFRKTFTLDAAPVDAYAAILASQRFEVIVNGGVAKAAQRDGSRGGRIAVLDLRSLLLPGENVIAIDISSHTEKGMNDDERKKYPASTAHLNAQSGFAFFLRCTLPDGRPAVQLGTDESWRTRRNPDGTWTTAAYADADWAPALPLPPGVAPVDEGPSLEPITRRDFANIPVLLGPQLSSTVSTAAQPGRIRAGLLAADPLQVALDRPNREVVIPVRANSATTIQALELTNGATLNGKLQRAAARLAKDPAACASLDQLFRLALGRPPGASEREAMHDLLGAAPKYEDIADFLWALVNHPEFQLVN
jgi:mono/diheme cytochrome c family protein